MCFSFLDSIDVPLLDGHVSVQLGREVVNRSNGEEGWSEVLLSPREHLFNHNSLSTILSLIISYDNQPL